MKHAASRTSRWAQLTSVSTGAGRGAWEVVQASESVTDQLRDIMLAGGDATLDSHVDLPRFPTKDELRLARPRRLVHRPFQATLSALWHATPAGLDGAGAPGNLFLHAALELGPGEPDPTRRAIDAWRSPIWLTPWDAQAVAAARFEEVQELPAGSLAGPEAALGFLDRPGVRVEALGPLVDAIAEALEGGSNVALVADSSDDGAAWIAVVSHLLPQAAAARLSWSTYERAATVDPLRGFPLNLCVFPSCDEEALDAALAGGSDFVLVKAHTKAAASDALLSSWAQLAQDLGAAPVEARLRVVCRRDEIVAENPDTMPTHPVRPLAEAIRADEYFAAPPVVEVVEVEVVEVSAPIDVEVDEAAAAAAMWSFDPAPPAVERPPAPSIPAQATAHFSEMLEPVDVGAPTGKATISYAEVAAALSSAEPRRARRLPLTRRRTGKPSQPADSTPMFEPSEPSAPADRPVVEDPAPAAATPIPIPIPIPIPAPAPAPAPAPVVVSAPSPEVAEWATESAGRVATIAAPRTSIEVQPVKPDLDRLWRDLQNAKDMGGAAAARYVHVALLDRECLFEAIPAAAPLSIRWEERAWSEMALAREALLADAATWHVRREPADAAVRVLRLVDFLIRARVASDRPGGPVSDRIVDLVHVHFRALAGVGGLEVQRRTGDLDARTKCVLQEAIWASGIPPHSFREALHLWLGISCWTRHPVR
ncbi:MAG: GAP1-M domain-containing protein [Sporichthyaceae bacterium]